MNTEEINEIHEDATEFDADKFEFEALDNLPLPLADGPGERGQDDSLPWPSP